MGTSKKARGTSCGDQIDLGSDRFVEKMQQRIGSDWSLHEIPVQQSRPAVRGLSYYAARYRDWDRAMAAAYRSGTYSMQEIGAYFSVSQMTVSRAVYKHEGVWTECAMEDLTSVSRCVATSR
jgi:putative transposase